MTGSLYNKQSIKKEANKVNEKVVKEIKNYMNNPLKYAILLEGTWGCGKTYFIQNQLKDIDTIYISLNGVSNLSNVSLQLAYQLGGDKAKLGKFKWFKNKKSSKAVGTIGGFLISFFTNSTIIELIDLVNNIDVKDKLIIFDDLERTKLPIEEILGFINNLVEHNNIKVLLVANEEELNCHDNYSKIKEKLIYQTIKYIPNLEEVYDCLMPNSFKEFKSNKVFFIDELKRKNHQNIRTIQFTFQRYIELRQIIDEVMNEVKCSSKIKKQIYNDIFKYMVVISRDYKMGKKINEFRTENLLSNYQLIENTYFSIPAFMFVNEFVQGITIDANIVKKTIENYIKEITTNTNTENSSLNILNRWWEAEDSEIEENTKNILKELKEDVYDFDLYPKILIYFVQLTSAGFPKTLLSNAMKYMKKNIDNCEEYASLGQRFLDSHLSNDEKTIFDKLKEELNQYIEKHNEFINKEGSTKVKTQKIGELGSYIYNWCREHHSEFTMKKKFLSEVGVGNILYVIQNGNVKDIRYLIYLFNETYNYANVKELYPDEHKYLIELNKKLKEFNIDNYNKMKKYNFNLLKEDLEEFIVRLN